MDPDQRTTSASGPTEQEQPDPDAAWQRLVEGNARFAADRPLHLGQDAARRADLREQQRPFAVVFGCSDSRVAAEIVFDQGLGDLFVVRTAGHVVDAAVLGSVEYAVAVLGVPLLLVLGHDGCGAVAATVAAVRTGEPQRGWIRDITERIAPSVLAAERSSESAQGLPAAIDVIEAEHVRGTVHRLQETSSLLRDAVGEGACRVVGATYRLADGAVQPVT